VAAFLIAAYFWNDHREATPAPAGSAASYSAGTQYRGLCLQLNDAHNPIEMYSPLIREIAALGANAILLSVDGYMEHAKARSIFIDARNTPSKTELVALIKEAKARGLFVIVM